MEKDMVKDFEERTKILSEVSSNLLELANVCDEDLKRIALMKTRKGTATSEAKRAQQILYSRNISHGGFGDGPFEKSNLTTNITRDYKTFKENNGYESPAIYDT